MHITAWGKLDLSRAHWALPVEGTIKINFDVAVSRHGLVFAAVSRDYWGMIEHIKIRQSPGCDPLKVEARVVRLATSVAKMHERHNIVLEGDSLSVLNQVLDQHLTFNWATVGEILICGFTFDSSIVADALDSS